MVNDEYVIIPNLFYCLSSIIYTSTKQISIMINVKKKMNCTKDHVLQWMFQINVPYALSIWEAKGFNILSMLICTCICEEILPLLLGIWPLYITICKSTLVRLYATYVNETFEIYKIVKAFEHISFFRTACYKIIWVNTRY